MVSFIHTADWQLGKPFAGVESDDKRALLRHERIAAIQRIGALAKQRAVSFVVVAGDLFDSTTPTKATVSAACSAIGAMEVPVFVVPGNHDHGGRGSVWLQDYFQREQQQLAPNLKVLLSEDAVELEDAVIFPCPLLRRHETKDPTACLQHLPDLDVRYGSKARIVLAHGSTIDFRTTADEEDDGGAVNVLDLSRLPESEFDYIALGDWHGTKQITAKAWYAGTPEPDRFAKGDDYSPGNVLVVRAGRGLAPTVERVSTARMEWKQIPFTFRSEADVPKLAEEVEAVIANRTDQALLQLRLKGALGIAASNELEQ